MPTLAVPLAVAAIAATGIILAAPSVLGRDLATFEWLSVVLVVAVAGAWLVTRQRRRERRRIRGMRDSALW